MKRVIQFLKTTVIGGFFVLLPLLLLQLMLAQMFSMMVAVTAPISRLLPAAWTQTINAPVLLAALLLLIVSFVLGLAARSQTGRRVGNWLEHNTIGRIPLYGVLKGLASRIFGIDEGEAFKPAMLVSTDGQREFAYLIEDHGNGVATIMLPWAPTPLSGRIKIVPMSQLEPLDASLSDLTQVLGQWGAGASQLIKRSP